MAPKFIHTVLLAVFSLLLAHCQNPPLGQNPKTEGYLYENEYGSIRILDKNPKEKRVIYTNNDGDVFDTLLTINPKMTLVPQQDSFPFLSLRMGGVEWTANYAQIWEFSGLAFLAQYIRIEQMYERRFFRTGVPITVAGTITQGKGGTQLDGIYLKDYTGSLKGYYIAHGSIKKERYPRAYYATPDSPQGMFGDTNQVHYRLVMENYTLEKPAVRRMTGYALNVNDQAHFVWEFADSESYKLEGHVPWTVAEEHQKITVEGILVQDEGGSVLKEWKILP